MSLPPSAKMRTSPTLYLSVYSYSYTPLPFRSDHYPDFFIFMISLCFSQRALFQIMPIQYRHHILCLWGFGNAWLHWPLTRFNKMFLISWLSYSHFMEADETGGSRSIPDTVAPNPRSWCWRDGLLENGHYTQPLAAWSLGSQEPLEATLQRVWSYQSDVVKDTVAMFLR